MPVGAPAARITGTLSAQDATMTVRIHRQTAMHELGIATSILESVQSAARRNPGVRITKVGVKIGELAGVDVDALQFGFECIVKDTEWEPLLLDVESIPRVQRCPKCQHEFRMTDYDPECPRCGEFATQCISGEELDIAYMEVDE
jgi:hydrogenase nickel incorporation protein HypA/HybF